MIIQQQFAPLRYTISSWRDLPQCLSNASSALRITVSDFVHNPLLSGYRISVVHPQLGTLFAVVLNGGGDLYCEKCIDVQYDINADQILNQLAQYGFLIKYAKRDQLSGQQLQYLMTIQGLHFDKLRRLSTWHQENGNKIFTTYVIAFKIADNPNWLNQNYCPSEQELNKALVAGSAINLSNVSTDQCYDWSWLDYVADINDILADNACEVNS